MSAGHAGADYGPLRGDVGPLHPKAVGDGGGLSERRILAQLDVILHAVELCRRHADTLTAPPRDDTERLLLALQRADNDN